MLLPSLMLYKMRDRWIVLICRQDVAGACIRTHRFHSVDATSRYYGQLNMTNSYLCTAGNAVAKVIHKRQHLPGGSLAEADQHSQGQHSRRERSHLWVEGVHRERGASGGGRRRHLVHWQVKQKAAPMRKALEEGNGNPSRCSLSVNRSSRQLSVVGDKSTNNCRCNRTKDTLASAPWPRAVPQVQLQACPASNAKRTAQLQAWEFSTKLCPNSQHIKQISRFCCFQDCTNDYFQ